MRRGVAHNQISIGKLVFIFIFLAVCSLTQANGIEKAPQVKKTVSSEAITVLVVGDSISAGFGIDKAQGWVQRLDQKMGEEFQFVNASISGDTSTGGRYRIDKALDSHKPQIVVIELGGNDGLRGTPIPLIERNLLEMTQRAQATGAKVVLLGMQIPPNYGARYTDAFKDMYPKIARQTNSVLVPFLLEGIAGVEGMMQEDGIHPTAQAQVLMVDHVHTALQSLR